MNSVDYLEKLALRNLAYEDIRTKVIDYCIENKIEDHDLMSDLFIIGFLFEARKQNEILTEQDIIILLGEDDNEDEDSDNLHTTYVLDDDDSNKSLQELLDNTVKNFYE